MRRNRAANPFADPRQKTLQDLHDHLARAPDADARSAREVRSAIHSFALWLDRTPGEIPAHPAFLRQAFRRLDPITCGVTRARLQNVGSLLKRGLTVLGIGPTSTWFVPLTPPWQALYDSIEDRYARELLSRFMRFCSGQRIKPDQVNDRTVVAFREALDAENMTAKPFIAAQSAVRLWNRMVDAVPGWPPQRLSRLQRVERYTLIWSDLPARFRADAERYLALQAGTDPTDPRAPPRALKPLSLQALRRYILQLVSALSHQGVDVSRFTSLADLYKPGHPRLALQYFVDRQKARKGPDTSLATSMISGLAHTLNIIAKHYLQVRPADMGEVTRLARHLRRRPGGMTEKNHLRLRQLDDPDRMRQFLSHPPAEMTKLARQRHPTRPDAVRYSTLLAIELLIVAPMRLHNLAALALDRHISLPQDGQPGPIRITIPRGDVKNDQPLDYGIPDRTVPLILAYLDRFRPLLMCTPSQALFPSYTDRAKRSDTLSKQISHLLKQELGIDWNPHLFRHLAARVMLRENPGNYEGARRLLAHRDLETTARIYAGHDMRPAVELYDRLIEDIRGIMPIRPNRRRPSGNLKSGV